VSIAAALVPGTWTGINESALSSWVLEGRTATICWHGPMYSGHPHGMGSGYAEHGVGGTWAFTCVGADTIISTAKANKPNAVFMSSFSRLLKGYGEDAPLVCLKLTAGFVAADRAEQ
jgi:hypothetical protein